MTTGAEGPYKVCYVMSVWEDIAQLDEVLVAELDALLVQVAADPYASTEPDPEGRPNLRVGRTAGGVRVLLSVDSRKAPYASADAYWEPSVAVVRVTVNRP